MKFDIGDEKRFFDFVGGLNDNDKVALISHTDLDGLVSLYVVNKIVKGDIIKFVNYEELASPLVQHLKAENVNKVIFSDLYIGNTEFVRELEEFCEILILDHHLAQKDWNSLKTTFLKCEDGYCAGYLCYYLFSKLQDITQLDWLVACSCVSDYCHIKTSSWLTSVFDKYGDKFEQVGSYVRKNGPIWDLQESLSLSLIYFKENIKEVFDRVKDNYGNISDLKTFADKVRGEVKRLVALFDKEKQSFEGGYLFEFTPKFACGSMVSTIVSGFDNHKTIITLRPDPDRDIYHVSARRQDKAVNMSDFLKSLVKGMEGADAGGHVPAAGGSFRKSDLLEFKKRLGVKI